MATPPSRKTEPSGTALATRLAPGRRCVERVERECQRKRLTLGDEGTALAAKRAGQRFRPRDLTPYFVALFAALLISYLVRPSQLLAFPLLERGVLGGLLNALPIGFAGVIFSTLLSRSEDATSSLGSNLVGAMAGGCLEYASIVTGLRFLPAIAIALYGAAFVLVARARKAVD